LSLFDSALFPHAKDGSIAFVLSEDIMIRNYKRTKNYQEIMKDVKPIVGKNQVPL